MRPRKYSLSDTLRELANLLKSVCPCVHVESQKGVSYEQEDASIFVDVISNVEDKVVCSDCLVDISLVVKNKDGGMPHLPRLQKMYSQLEDMFPIVGERFVLWNPEIALTGNDDAGNNVWAVRSQMRIKVQPSSEGSRV